MFSVATDRVACPKGMVQMDQATALQTGDLAAWMAAGEWDESFTCPELACGNCGGTYQPIVARRGVTSVAYMPVPEGHGQNMISFGTYATEAEASESIRDMYDSAVEAATMISTPAMLGDLARIMGI